MTGPSRKTYNKPKAKDGANHIIHATHRLHDEHAEPDLLLINHVEFS